MYNENENELLCANLSGGRISSISLVFFINGAHLSKTHRHPNVMGTKKRISFREMLMRFLDPVFLKSGWGVPAERVPKLLPQPFPAAKMPSTPNCGNFYLLGEI